MNLNARALRRCQRLMDDATACRVAVERSEGGAQLIDCGIDVPGGLEAGRALAEVCMADLGRVDFVPGDPNLWPGIAVTVTTDQPLLACMAAQYAGWPIGGDHFYAMASGPMRAVRGREDLFERIGYREEAPQVIGVLESPKMPSADICLHVAEDCGVEIPDVTLLVAPTSSIAGTIQIVARSIETAMHKLFELGYDLSRVRSGYGVAPLPPVAADDVIGIARTNDAILYGREVTLWIDDDAESLEKIGPHIPSNSSKEHGRSFAELFEQYDHDFYKIDPHLFSPAVVVLIDLKGGRLHRFGAFRPDVIRQSFQG